MNDIKVGIKSFFENLSKDEINKINKKQLEMTKKEHKNFSINFENNKCYICNLPLSKFDENKIYYHWLLRPAGIKKSHIKNLLNSGKGYLRITTYLRWVANTEIPFRNISDLSEEMADDKIFEVTIKYKNLEWSFSCSPSDYKGHSSSRFANFPHYHFQMKINNKMFIKFSDFHPPFNKEDLFSFEAQKMYPKKIKFGYTFGEGMNFILDKQNIEKTYNLIKTSKDENKATFDIQSVIEAPEGKTISGSLIKELIEESKCTGIPLSKLLRQLDDVKVTSIISPGKGVPEIKKRKRKKTK